MRTTHSPSPTSAEESSPKVLHLITSLGVGGAEMMLLNVLQQPAMAQTSPRVISLTGVGEIGRRIRLLGVPVQALGMKPGRADPRALLRLVAILRLDPPDLLQTWMYHADLLGGVAAKLAHDIPVVWGIHHTLGAIQSVKDSTLAVLRLNARLSGWMPRRVVCCAESARQAHLQAGYAAGKMVVIPNGIDPQRFQPDAEARGWLRQQLGVPADALLVGMFARFHPQKDHHTFAQAAGNLHARLPQVHFMLAGEDMTEDNPALQAWFDDAGVSARVHLLGMRQDVPRLMAGVDVGTLSSAYGEALPLALVEMMACGVPCAVTAVGDAAAVVGTSGRIVPPGDARALAEAWEALLVLEGEERQALGRQARHIVEVGYNIQTTAERYLTLYRSLLSKT